MQQCSPAAYLPPGDVKRHVEKRVTTVTVKSVKKASSCSIIQKKT